jgi:hypothetical protein
VKFFLYWLLSLAAYAASFIGDGWWLVLRGALLGLILAGIWVLGYETAREGLRDGG